MLGDQTIINHHLPRYHFRVATLICILLLIYLYWAVIAQTARPPHPHHTPAHRTHIPIQRPCK